ncbi:MAG: alkaline phosphatase family protein, partial [bacterium]|nr:alkaline phosphatase family protein [bacterium]
WDDHDFGVNDGGKECPMIKESKKEFLEFFDVPENSPRRKRDGIYTSYLLGPKGKG